MSDAFVLKFPTQDLAQAALDAVNVALSQLYAAQGYGVDGEGVIGKNVKTGLDAPEAQKTIRWDTVKQSTSLLEWWFYSPVCDERFTDWRDYLPDGIDMPQDDTFSAEDLLDPLLEPSQLL